MPWHEICAEPDVKRCVVAGQRLELGLLDEVAIDLVPVVMGAGRRFFGELAAADVALGNPTTCVQGDQVTHHLVFPVLH